MTNWFFTDQRGHWDHLDMIFKQKQKKKDHKQRLNSNEVEAG